MGGSQSPKKILIENINLRHDRLNIADIDRLFEKAFSYAKECEIIRCQFLPKWNDFIRKSGAIVLETPTFDAAVQGMLWKFGVDFNGNVYNCEINEDEPFITFKDSSLLKNEDIDISNSFNELCRFRKLNIGAVDTLEKNFKLTADDMRFLNKDQETLLSERGVALIEIFSHINMLNLNIKRIKLAYMIIAKIKDIFEDIYRGLNKYAYNTRNPNEMKIIELIVKKANDKKLTRPHMIVYQLSKEDKLLSYEDHFDAIDEEIKAEKYAQQFLESYAPSLVQEKILVVPLSKSVALPTTTYEKERKPSQTGIDRERLLTRTTMETRPVIEERGLVKDEIIAEMTIPTEQKVIIPMEPTLIRGTTAMITYDQKYLQNKAIENSKLKRANTQFKKSVPPEELFIADPGNHHLLKSLSLKEEPMHNQEMQRLRRELEELRKQNEMLTEKLTIVEGKERNPLKFPVYIKHHVPIKSWAFNLKKSVSASEQQKIEVIESAQDFDYIITGGNNGQIIFWKFASLTSVYEAKTMTVHEGPVKALLYLNDGKTLLSGGKDGKLMKCDMSIFSSSVIEGGAQGAIRALANSFNGFSVLAACEEKIVSYDFFNNKILWVIEAHEEPISTMVYNQQKDILISASKDKTIKIWNINTKECLGVLQGNLDIIKSICCAYTNEYLYIVSVSKDGFITFWNMSDKNLTKSYKMNSIAQKVMYLSDKKTVCTVHKKGKFALWNIEKGENREFSQGSQIYVNGCYYDDGHHIILSTANGMLEFWHSR